MGAELATTADTVMTAETEPRVELKADQKAEPVERAELKAEHELIAELRAELGREAVLEGRKSRHGCHLDNYTLNERKSRHGCHLDYYTPNEWQDLKKRRHDQLRDRTLTSAILPVLGSPTRTQAKISPFSSTEDVLTSRSLRERIEKERMEGLASITKYSFKKKKHRPEDATPLSAESGEEQWPGSY